MFLIAHRAMSPAAVRAAAAQGARYFELDVRVAGEGVAVTHFVPLRWLRGRIERDNARFRVRGGWPRDHALADVLAALPADATVLFDPKDKDSPTRAVLAERLAAAVGEPGRHLVSTGNRRDLAMFRATGFRTWRTLDRVEQIREAAGATFPDAGATVRHTALTADTVRLLHGVTDTVVAWTVNDPRRATRLAGHGVDGITTDRLAALAHLATV